MADARQPLTPFYVGSRGSDLALWQAHHAIHMLTQAHPYMRFAIKTYTSAGDIDREKPLPLIDGRGVFTKVLDDALIKGEIDIAVHSHKDLPIEPKSPLATAAVLKREQACDVVISQDKKKLKDLPDDAIIGTSSTRRSAQILALNQKWCIKNIRGNVATRIEKVVKDKAYDATLLAYAGVKRLGLLDLCAEIVPFDQMLPAPAQGSIALLCRKDSPAFSLVATINHYESRLCTECERGFLFGLGGGCSMPIAAFAHITDQTLSFCGKIISPDGTQQFLVEERFTLTAEESFNQAFTLGLRMAHQALAKGASSLLYK